MSCGHRWWLEVRRGPRDTKRKEWQWEREFGVDVAVVLIGFAYAYIHRKQMCQFLNRGDRLVCLCFV